MKRVVEPELMNNKDQAEAYAAADFEQAHQSIVDAFELYFSGQEIEGHILDLGCGPGDIAFRYAKRFPKSTVTGVDGSGEMIRLANERNLREDRLCERVRFIEGVMPEVLIPEHSYSAIVSNSLLHHLHHPEVLWLTIKKNAVTGSKILISDLFRPANKEDAQQMVDRYSAIEPEVLRRDFYNSLLAAFTIEEIEQQIADARLDELQLTKLSDRHVVVFGTKR